MRARSRAAAEVARRIFKPPASRSEHRRRTRGAGTGRPARRDPESVSLGVAALVDEWSGSVVKRQRLERPLGVRVAAARAVAFRIWVVTGGASVGERASTRQCSNPGHRFLEVQSTGKLSARSLGKALVMGLTAIRPSAIAWTVLLADFLAGRPDESAGALPVALRPLDSGPTECGPRETFHRAR